MVSDRGLIISVDFDGGIPPEPWICTATEVTVKELRTAGITDATLLAPNTYDFENRIMGIYPGEESSLCLVQADAVRLGPTPKRAELLQALLRSLPHRSVLVFSAPMPVAQQELLTSSALVRRFSADDTPAARGFIHPFVFCADLSADTVDYLTQDLASGDIWLSRVISLSVLNGKSVRIFCFTSG